MSLEDILKDPDKCLKIASSRLRRMWHRVIHRRDYPQLLGATHNWAYMAGIQWPDERFNKSAKQIISAATEDPIRAQLAGRDWSDERFNLAAEQIIESITQLSQTSYTAGLNWKDERFDSAAEQIINMIIQDPRLCYKAQEEWRTKRYERFAEQFAAGIVKNSELCFQAGLNWRDERFNAAAQKIADGVTLDPNSCYAAGREWMDERFNRFAEQITAKVTEDPELCFLAGMHWTDERLDGRLLAKVKDNSNFTQQARSKWSRQRAIILDSPEMIKYLSEIEPQYRTEFWQFMENIGTQHMQKLPIKDFYLATDAHSFAKQADSEKLFYKGLEESIEKGSVEKWAKTIIKYFRQNAKGAGNYRVLEVTA